MFAIICSEPPPVHSRSSVVLSRTSADAIYSSIWPLVDNFENEGAACMHAISSVKRRIDRRCIEVKSVPDTKFKVRTQVSADACSAD